MALKSSIFLLLWLSLTALPAFSQSPAGDSQGNGASIQASRDTLAQWIETQRIISSEESSWQTTKLALEGRIALVQQELDDLNNKVAQSNKTISEEETRKSNLQRDLEAAKSATQSLIEAAAALEAEIVKLKTILPDPILKKVQALYDRIPEDPNSTKVSLAERYQNILGILNEADKANNELIVLSEVREIPGATPTEVETIYVGLAQAYFVNADRNFAGTGRPVGGKWQWERLDGISTDVAEMLSVISAKGKPRFVHLPIQID